MSHRDAFTCWLQAHHPEIPLACYQPGACFGGPPLGWELRIGRTLLVYRIPEDAPHVFYVVLIRRGEGPRTLRSPFADLVRLLRLIQQSNAGVRWIRGHVEVSSERPDDALPADRILAFYRRYLTTVCDGVENGVQWYGGDLTTFRWNDEKRKVPLPADTRNLRAPRNHPNR